MCTCHLPCRIGANPPPSINRLEYITGRTEEEDEEDEEDEEYEENPAEIRTLGHSCLRVEG
jgi:hypothetical protein